MANPEPSPRRRRIRRPGRGRIVAIAVVVAFFVLLASLRGLAGFYTDYLWFKSLGLVGVWRAVLGARVVLTVLFMAVFAVFLWVNLVLADRFAPAFRPPGPEEEMIERYYQAIGSRVGLVRVGVAVLFGLIAGAGVSSKWNEWILFTHAVDFGQKDAQFGKDIGFYVFRLPFITFVVNWAFAAVVIVTLVTAGWHYLNGGIRVQTRGEHVTAKAKAHLSALLALLALVKAADYWYSRYELTTSTRGVVDGATYTDVKAQLPALLLLLVISLFAVVLLLVNVRRRGMTLPAITVALWAFVAIVAGAIYPAFVQRVQVEPAESSKERLYVQRNIDATRAAYQLDTVETKPLDTYNPNATADDLRRNASTIRDARLLDPAEINETYQKLQSDRQFYTFKTQALDVDRYVVDGRLTPMIVGTRELNPRQQDSWENAHVVYTHGFGVVMAPANTSTADGAPDFVVRDVPTKVDPGVQVSIDNPRLYYGDGLTGYAVINARRQEVDYLDESGNEQPYTHGADTGVAMGSFVRRAAFALRFGQIEPLISNFVTGQSRIIYIRDVRDRVQTIAPFLRFDHDPYPVVVDGRVQYVIDGYTTTSRYPYAQRASGVSGNSGLGGGVNYVRNSVRAVVDAYTGVPTFYVIDPTDPIIRAYEKAFPELFTPGDQIPSELRAHMRYPQDLYEVQSAEWARYHVDDPRAFLSKSDRWSVSPDPGSAIAAAPASGATSTTRAVSRNTIDSSANKQPAYYSQVRLPGDTTDSFGLMRTFVAVDDNGARLEMTGFMFGALADDGRARLRVFVPPANAQLGPALFASNSNSFPDVSKEISLLNVQGSKASYGDVLLIPLDNSVLFVRPLYVTDATNQVPTLKRVVVGIGDKQAIGTTLREALEKLVNASVPELGGVPSTAPSTPAPGSGSSGGSSGASGGSAPTGDPTLAQVRSTLERALALQAEALQLEANRQYDQAAAKRAEAQRLIEEATKAAGGRLPSLSTAATTTTAPSAPPTTTATAAPSTTLKAQSA